MDIKGSQTLSPTSSGRRIRTSPCSSPEFEFWMVRNPSFPQPNILSADELFVNGVLLPLHLLNKSDQPKNPNPEPPNSEPPPEPPNEPSPVITDSTAAGTTFSASKRWKDIFRKKTAENNNNTNAEEKAKKKEKRSGSDGGTNSAELNINIWPFSRSRSAGTRPKLFPGSLSSRKVNSAPCSRSNSAGESKSRKWPSSPGRAGVHLGRSSPVWQVRRSKNQEPLPLKKETTTSRRSKLGSSSGGSAKTRVLNLNVPMCIGHGHQLSCRSDENSAIRVSGGSDIRSSSNRVHVHPHAHTNTNLGVGGKLFNLRSLFTKKSVVTSH